MNVEGGSEDGSHYKTHPRMDAQEPELMGFNHIGSAVK